MRSLDSGSSMFLRANYSTVLNSFTASTWHHLITPHCQLENTNVGNYNQLRAKIVFEGESVLLVDGGSVLLEDGGPLLRDDFHGAQWIQDDRGVREDVLGSGKGGGSRSTANCNNEDTFTF